MLAHVTDAGSSRDAHEFAGARAGWREAQQSDAEARPPPSMAHPHRAQQPEPQFLQHLWRIYSQDMVHIIATTGSPELWSYSAGCDKNYVYR